MPFEDDVSLEVAEQSNPEAHENMAGAKFFFKAEGGGSEYIGDTAERGNTLALQFLIHAVAQVGCDGPAKVVGMRSHCHGGVIRGRGGRDSCVQRQSELGPGLQAGAGAAA